MTQPQTKREGRKETAIRWTVHLAASEFGSDRAFITRQLKADNAIPGADGKYSTRQIVDAILGSTKLEREAREARHRQAIDEATQTRNELMLQEGKLCYVAQVRDRCADLFTKAVQIVKHWDVSDQKKKQVIKTLAELTMPPRKIVAFP
jgi:hypothetical protein